MTITLFIDLIFVIVMLCCSGFLAISGYGEYLTTGVTIHLVILAVLTAFVGGLGVKWLREFIEEVSKP